MYLAGINKTDTANGPGFRVSVFVSGCDFHCQGCFNPEAQSFDFGVIFDDRHIVQILNALEPDYIDGLTILGGEPLHPRNITTVNTLICKAKEAYPHKSIWLYTGYTLGELQERAKTEPIISDLLFSQTPLVDTLVDGRFVQRLKDPSLAWRGSSNQRIIDLHKLNTTSEEANE